MPGRIARPWIAGTSPAMTEWGQVKSGISEPFIERLILRGMKLFRVKPGT